MNEQITETIHRYLMNAMTPEERAAFEAEISQDEQLRRTVDGERAMLEGLVFSRMKQLENTISSVRQNLRQEGFFEQIAHEEPQPLQVVHSVNNSIMKKILAYAAVLIVLAGGIWFFANRKQPVDTEALYAKFYKPDADKVRAQQIAASLENFGLAGAQTDADSLKMALELYEAGKNEEALALLKAISEVHPDNDIAQYYIGVIHMNEGRYAKAVEILLPLSKLESSDLRHDAMWNLGLCYLQSENGEQDARAAFSTLAEDTNYADHRSAKALLEQLFPK